MPGRPNRSSPASRGRAGAEKSACSTSASPQAPLRKRVTASGAQPTERIAAGHVLTVPPTVPAAVHRGPRAQDRMAAPSRAEKSQDQHTHLAASRATPGQKRCDLMSADDRTPGVRLETFALSRVRSTVMAQPERQLLVPKPAAPLTGAERFVGAEAAVIDFWQWGL